MSHFFLWFGKAATAPYRHYEHGSGVFAATGGGLVVTVLQRGTVAVPTAAGNVVDAKAAGIPRDAKAAGLVTNPASAGVVVTVIDGGH